MYKSTFKRVLVISVSTVLFLFSFVSIIDALEIEKMSPDNWSSSEGWDYGYGAYHGTYLKTDRPYYTVHWHVNGIRVQVTPGGYEGDENGPTTDSFYTYLTGSVQGKKYEIKAQAWDQEDHLETLSDTKSYTVTVYKSLVDESKGTITGCWGWAEITQVTWKEIPRPGRTSNWEAVGSSFLRVFNPTAKKIGTGFWPGHYVARINPKHRGGQEDDDVIQYLVGPNGAGDIKFPIVKPGTSEVHHDSVSMTLHTNNWEDGDTFRVKMNVKVAAYHLGDDANDDEWTAKAEATHTIEEDD